MPNESLTYSVPGVNCEHCRVAITSEVSQVAGVVSVEVDLEAKRVIVEGQEVSDASVRAAIDDAGYEVAT